MESLSVLYLFKVEVLPTQPLLQEKHQHESKDGIQGQSEEDFGEAYNIVTYHHNECHMQ